MKQMLKWLPFSLLMILIFSGCNTKNEVENPFKYRNSYVGDNNAVGNIVRQLEGANYIQGFELKTKDMPYGIMIG